jgi:cold shock CspA family protein
MRLTGTLSSWKDDRGFGFIAPTHGGVELFVHISSLPRNGTRPTVGEKLSYEIGRGKNGQPQAMNVQRVVIGPIRRPGPKRQRPIFPMIVVALLMMSLGVLAFNKYQRLPALSPSLSPEPAITLPASRVEATHFKCDGRTHCSHMTSCKEAKFFLENCPGTQMDGDNDGTPCEQQWCTNLVSE